MVYNLLTCGGWEGKVGSFVASSDCLMSRLGLVILFFFIAIVRKWGGEEMGIEFNFIFSLVFGIIPYILIVFLVGSFKIALVAGIAGSLIGGYGAGVVGGGE